MSEGTLGDLPLLDGFPASARLVDLRRDRELGLSDLKAQAKREAAALAAGGGPAGSPAVVAHASAFDSLAALFAVWASGRPAVLCSPRLTAEERAAVQAHTGASIWLGRGGSGPPPSGGPALQALDHGPLAPDASALILMTSGTTGTPKGVTHSLAGLEARLRHNVRHIGAADLARSLCVLPAFFGHGLIGNCLTPLAAGGTLFLLDGPDVAEMRGMGDRLDRLGITFLSSVPSFWTVAMRLSQPPRQSLRRVHVGSEPLSLVHWRAIARWSGADRVCNMYGMTEAANWIGGAVLEEAGDQDGHVGLPWGGDYAVLTEDGRIAAAGRGEVLVRSPSMMLGYFKDPGRTAAAFVEGRLRTGDLGELGADGRLTLIGRLKHEINRAGIKIQPEEIERLLERHPAIAAACAFGVADAVSGEAVAAAIVPAAGTSLDLEAVRAWCRERIRPEAVPAHLHAIDELPRTDRGKTDRAALRRSLEGRGTGR